VARDSDEPFLALGRGARHDLHARQLLGDPGVVPACERRAPEDVIAVEAGLRRDGGRGRRVIAGHDDRLDTGRARRRERLADPVPERVREPDQRRHRPRAVAVTGGQRHRPFAARRRALDQDLPGRARHPLAARLGQDGLWRADHPGSQTTVGEPRDGARERPVVRDRLRLHELGPVEGRRDAVDLDGAQKRSGERAGGRAGARGPRVLLGTQRLAQQREPFAGIHHGSGRCPDRGHLEPVACERARLVGDDEVDRTERFLGIEAAHEDAPLQEPVRAEAQDDREQDRRLLGDRGDRGRDPGQQVLACVLAAQEPERRDDRDEPHRDDEQDPDEPIELELERRAAAATLGQSAGDAAKLGCPARGDDDPLATPRDDARAAVRHRASVCQRRVNRIRGDVAGLGHRLPGEDASVELEPIRRT
jgi:hypothetical protein